MATATKTASFPSTLQAWASGPTFADVGDSSLLSAVWSADGTPDGSLEWLESSGGANQSERMRTEAMSWETMFGISTGQTVTNIQITDWDMLVWDVSNITSLRLRMRVLSSDGSSTVHSAGELWDETNLPTDDNGVQHSRGAGTSRAIDAPYQASNTQVRLECQVDLVYSGSGGILIDYEQTNIDYQITYSAGGIPAKAGAGIIGP